MKIKNNIAVMTVILITLVSAVISLFCLPDKIAVQWNEDGVSNTADKFLILVFPVLSFVSAFIHDINSKGSTRKSGLISLTVSLVLFALQGIVILNALGYINMLCIDYRLLQTISLLTIGLVICVCGNYMPKFIINYYCGVKVPFAYKSSDLWTKVQRFAGKLWFVSGLVIIMLSFVQYKKISSIVLCIIFCLIIIPRIYGRNQYSESEK